MITYPNRPIRTGYAFRDGKLYYFGKHGILVASQWPDMRAWRKTPKRPHWQQVRPKLRIHFIDGMWTGYLDSYREKKHRPKSMGRPLRFRINEPQPIAYDDEFIDIDRQQEEEDEDSDELLSSEERLKRAYQAFSMERERQLHAEYLHPVPKEVLRPVSEFAERNWHLLNLAARCPGGLDLIHSNPALSVALSSLWVFRENPPSQPLDCTFPSPQETD